jgi:VanZ family protein
VPKKVWLIAAVVYTVFLTVMSLINLDAVPEIGSDFDDKIYHFLAYLVLGFLWVWVALNSTVTKAWSRALLYCLFYGVALELIQHQINSNRTFDIIDMLSNCVGVLFGTIIAHYIFKQNVKLI